MREASLVARRDDHGEQVLVVHRPISFNLDQTARAMHAIVDPQIARSGSRQRVGRSRVRDVVRRVATDGWPPDFTPNIARVMYWRNWLIEQAVFTDDETKR